MSAEGKRVPNVVFRTRVRDESVGGDNPYRWEDVQSKDLFKRKRVVLFSLPGAFTPTCSTYQLPNFEKLYTDFQDCGIKEIYCLSVNDSFVMNAWFNRYNIWKVKPMPDGNARFTQGMHMLVQKENLGFGERSWRYAMVVNNGKIEAWFEEPGFENNCETDPYGETSPENVMNYLKASVSP